MTARCEKCRLMPAHVHPVVAGGPGLAVVGRGLDELAHAIGAFFRIGHAVDDLRAVLIELCRHHHLSFDERAAPEARAAGGVAVILFPACAVPRAEALAAVTDSLVVLEDHAFVDDELDAAARDSLSLGFDVPFAQPEIELAILRIVPTRILIFLRGGEELRPLRIVADRQEIILGVELLGIAVAVVDRLLEVLECLVLVAEARVCAREAERKQDRRGMLELARFLERGDGARVVARVVTRDAELKPVLRRRRFGGQQENDEEQSHTREDARAPRAALSHACAELSRSDAEMASECEREMRVARVPELQPELAEGDRRVAQALQRERQTQAVTIARNRLARARAKNAAELKRRLPARAGERAQRDVLGGMRGDDAARVLDGVGVAR